jgi:hypothetical protein
MPKPICIDLFCGLGGWSEAFLAEGYECVGYDIEAHDYGTGGYPGKLILRDVRSIHGSEFKDAAVIVASPPCQEYSYMAMPWSLSKAKARAIEADETGVMRSHLTLLFNECFRLQREASEAAGRHIPMIVENVRGAQKWVGRARWNYGSFYLWGDVPALMPHTFKARKHDDGGWRENGTLASCNVSNVDGRKVGKDWFGGYGGGFGWDSSPMRRNSSKSTQRKMASAMIAKIPFPLAQHIARTFKPE